MGKESALRTLMKSEDKARKPPPFHHHFSRANAIAFYSLLFDFMVGRSVREHSNGIRWRIRPATTGQYPTAFSRWAKLKAYRATRQDVAQRKWRSTKQQPSRARAGYQISCCLLSLHFLCDILLMFTV